MRLYLRNIVLIGAVLAIAPAATVSAADAAAHVTTVIGDATANGHLSLEQAGVLDEGGKLATGEDGKCSLLVDDDALLEVCENTQLTLERDGRARVVRLDAGSIRIIAEPRQAQERIEIHTPAAIATLLGTIVHVEVDPVTGLTVVTSTHSNVKVRSADARVKGSTTVKAYERISVAPGVAPPARTVRVDEEQLADLEGCLVDLRGRALSRDLDELQLAVLERLSDFDRRNNDLPGGGDESPESPLSTPVIDLAGNQDTCNAVDCQEMGSMPANQSEYETGGELQFPEEN